MWNSVFLCGIFSISDFVFWRAWKQMSSFFSPYGKVPRSSSRCRKQEVTAQPTKIVLLIVMWNHRNGRKAAMLSSWQRPQHSDIVITAFTSFFSPQMFKLRTCREPVCFDELIWHVATLMDVFRVSSCQCIIAYFNGCILLMALLRCHFFPSCLRLALLFFCLRSQ